MLMHFFTCNECYFVQKVKKKCKNVEPTSTQTTDALQWRTLSTTVSHCCLCVWVNWFIRGHCKVLWGTMKVQPQRRPISIYHHYTYCCHPACRASWSLYKTLVSTLKSPCSSALMSALLFSVSESDGSGRRHGREGGLLQLPERGSFKVTPHPLKRIMGYAPLGPTVWLTAWGGTPGPSPGLPLLHTNLFD